jgi:hypothetical protein
MAAWLHDVGYGESVAATGFHPVDGANWLEGLGLPPGVVALVAHHSGARFEAEERGLGDVLARFPEPDRDQLDVLTLIDMSTSPTGRRISVQERLAEILKRYPAWGSPLNRSCAGHSVARGGSRGGGRCWAGARSLRAAVAAPCVAGVV